MQLTDGLIARRPALLRLVLFWLALHTSKEARANTQPAHCFVGHYNKPGSKYFSIGGLIVQDLTSQRAKVHTIRAITKFTRVLRSRSTDRYKAPFASAMLHHLLEDQGMRFICLQFITDNWPDNAIERDVKFSYMHRMLIDNSNLVPTQKSILYLIDHGVTPPSALADDLGALSPLYPEVNFSFYDEDDLLQISSFFTGLANAIPEKSEIRKQVLREACTQLDIRQMTPEVLQKNKKFQMVRIAI